MIYILSKILQKIQISSIVNSNISNKAKYGYRNNLKNISLGKYSYIGNDCTIVNTSIGSFCSIANGTIIGGGSHPIDWVSTSPVFYKGRNIFKKNYNDLDYKQFKKTNIGNDVWIGSNVLIKSGVNIGDGVVIGMGSVITKDIPSYEIWAGNPGRKIKDRFDINLKQAIADSKWWLLSENELIEASKTFDDPKRFVEEGLK